MNTVEINHVLRGMCAENFDGVFSADNLPEEPRLLVVNTDSAFLLANPVVIGCA